MACNDGIARRYYLACSALLCWLAVMCEAWQRHLRSLISLVELAALAERRPLLDVLHVLVLCGVIWLISCVTDLRRWHLLA